jgi:hypothetical protein
VTLRAGTCRDQPGFARSFGEKADVMLFRSKDKSECAGGATTVHLEAHGVFKGKSVDATEIDACQANPEASFQVRFFNRG